MDYVAIACGHRPGQLEDDDAEAFAENGAVGSGAEGRLSPVAERAGFLLKHMYMKMSLKVSMPPVMAISERPA